MLHYYRNLNNENDGISSLLRFLTADHFMEATKLLDEVRQRKNGETIVYHGCYELRVLVIAFWALINRHQLYWCPHGSFQRQTLTVSRLRKIIFHTLISKLVLIIVKKVVFVSYGEFKNSAWLVPKHKGIVIHNGLDLQHSSRTQQNRLMTMDRAGENVFVGRVDVHHKGIDRLKAFAEAADISVDIYGPLREITLSDLGQNLIYKGCINKQSLYSTLKTYKKIILLSRYEGLPMSLIEGMSVGCVPIVTSETNVGSFISEYECGYIVESKQDFKDALNAFDLQQIGQTSAMRARCMALVNEKFDILATVQSWRQLGDN